jgi:glutamate racemase
VSQISTRFEVIAHPAPLLVPLVEEGWLSGQVPRLAIERYLAPLIEAKVSVLVLGCTHYPLLKELIGQVAEELSGFPVAVVDSAEATALVTRALLSERQLEASAALGKLELLVTDLPASFRESATRFLGAQVGDVAQVDLHASVSTESRAR